MRCSRTEMMVVAASRLLEDGRTVLTGTGMPVLASLLARETRAPRLSIIFEAGSISPLRPPALPLSVGDSMTAYRAVMAASMDYVMCLAQAGYADYAFLGAAQIDPYGNLNTTVIGPYERPRVRLPGSGGANDFGSLSWRTIVLMRQDRSRFVERLDFLTTPGYLTGRGARERAGLPRGTGPWRVVTQLGIYGFGEDGRMELLRVYPGVTLEEVRGSSSFEIRAGQVEEEPEPTARELRTLRRLDPHGMVTGRG
ncbi:MAG: 3-oxoacid CoA-transferase [Hadesarchaea archaeon]|nr:MAG: 3-oxoacid CoA-transferase [Hadesarchaea archaeon]